jgi:hypothetical protein
MFKKSFNSIYFKKNLKDLSFLRVLVYLLKWGETNGKESLKICNSSCIGDFIRSINKLLFFR